MAPNRKKYAKSGVSELEDELEKADACNEILAISIELIKALTIIYPKCKTLIS